MSIAQSIIGIFPNVLWVCFATFVVCMFRRPIYNALAHLQRVKVAGIECLFVQEAISAAVALAQKHPRWKVQVTVEQERLAMLRASHHQDLLKGAGILWVDDVPENNKNEIKMFYHLQAHIDTATSTGEAIKMFQSVKSGGWVNKGEYDLVISDIKRGADVTAGIDMLDNFQHQKIDCPVIFYVGELDPQKGEPVGAFGLTNRPDELVHLVLDVLERTKPPVSFRNRGAGFP